LKDQRWFSPRHFFAAGATVAIAVVATALILKKEPNNVRASLNSYRSGWMSLALIPVLGLAVCSRAPNAAESTPASAAASPAATVQTKTYRGVGVVKALNPKKLVIEIDHEDIPDLMPAMQMSFYVKDKSLLDGIKRDDRIDFTLENGVGGLKITAIKKR
jgi:Cu/Ag efflux protein CusF